MNKKYLKPVTMSVFMEASLTTMQSVSSQTGLNGVSDTTLSEGEIIK